MESSLNHKEDPPYFGDKVEAEIPGQGHYHMCPELMDDNPPGRTARCTEQI
jgi:hypothetical protein